MELKNYFTSMNALRVMTDDLISAIQAQKKERSFHLALSGGGTAKQMFSLWTTEYRDRIPWSRIRFHWVDERCVRPDDNESNFGHARRQLFDPMHIANEQIFRIHGEDDPQQEALRYEREVAVLPCRNGMAHFDAVILGVGPDLHTASIFPSTKNLLTDQRLYAVSRHPESGQWRITMTGPFILNSTPLFVPILGKDKREVVRKLREGYSADNDFPATYILSKAERATVYASEL